MMNIVFSLNNETCEISGFDLGNIELIISDTKLITSKGKNPDQSMMIFLTIVDLLDGLRKLVSDKNQSDFRLIGVDSSFTVNFIKNADRIKVVAYQEELCELIREELLQKVFTSCKDFFESNKSMMSETDPVLEDIKQALFQFDKMLRSN